VGSIDNNQLDYIVVGQGLAGSAAAVHLFRRNKKFVVFDLPIENSSSSIAAGLFNPITGKNWVKTWKADLLFPYMLKYFQEVEELLRRKFLTERPIYRPFSSLSEQNDWMSRRTDPSFRNYVDRIFTNEVYQNLVINIFGGVQLKNTGYLNIPDYIQAVAQFLREQNRYVVKKFLWKDVQLKDDDIVYRNYRAKKIILCEGSIASENHMWEFLPFRLVKGEILTIKTDIDFNVIFNRGVFIISLGNGVCKVGSTYDWENLKKSPTEEGKREIMTRLKVFFKPEYKILDHVAGIRPATLDRRPFIGTHPIAKNIVIFNGLGTKGVTLAPYYANQLLNHLETGSTLDREVNIERYFR